MKISHMHMTSAFHTMIIYYVQFMYLIGVMRCFKWYSIYTTAALKPMDHCNTAYCSQAIPTDGTRGKWQYKLKTLPHWWRSPGSLHRADKLGPTLLGHEVTTYSCRNARWSLFCNLVHNYFLSSCNKWFTKVDPHAQRNNIHCYFWKWNPMLLHSASWTMITLKEMKDVHNHVKNNLQIICMYIIINGLWARVTQASILLLLKEETRQNCSKVLISFHKTIFFWS